MGPSGDIAATWVDAAGIHAGGRAAGGPSFRQQLVSTYEDNVNGSSTAVNASGTVVVAWVDSTAEQYEIAVHRRGEAFSTPIDVGATGGLDGQGTSVAIDDAGDVLVGEAEKVGGGYNAAYSWRPAGGSFIQTTISEPSSEPSLPVVVMDGAGDALIAWNDKSAGPHDIARAITRPAGGAFGTTQNLTAYGPEYAFNVTAAIGAGGQLAVVWQRGGTTPPYVIEASTSAGPAHPLSAPQVISPAGSTDVHPAVTVGGNGEVVAAWEHSGATQAVDAASAVVGTTFGAAADVSANGSVGTPQVATDAAGNAVIAWGVSSLGEFKSIDVVTRAAGGTTSPEVILSALEEKIDAAFPYTPSVVATVGMDSSGDALVGWEEFTEHTVKARIYDATGPTLKLEVPATATAGQSVIFTSSAKDLFSGVGSTTWSFGDGAGATGISPSHIYTAPGTYTVFATAADLVGNPTVASTQITVLPAPIPPLVACATGSASAGGSCPPAPLLVRCHVPSLKGLTSAAAKHRLSSAHCRAGKVSIARRYRHSKRLVVSAQSVRASTTLPFGASVSLTLKPAPPRRHKHRR
jgi:PKD repeat protein